jgi:hypothetical protein
MDSVLTRASGMGIGKALGEIVGIGMCIAMGMPLSIATI